MSFELFLDFLLSFVVLSIYHSDCHSDRTPAYACVSIETPLFAPVHREFAPTRHVAPEDYGVDSYLVQPGDPWIADPMDTPVSDESQVETVDEFFQSIWGLIADPEPVAAPVLVAMLESMILPVSSETKAATVPQLRSLAVELGLLPAGKKAELNEMVLNAFANRGIGMYEVGGILFKPSADDTVMNILT